MSMTFLPITLTAHVTRLADYHLRQDSRRPAIPPIYRPISGPVVAEQRAEQRAERREQQLVEQWSRLEIANRQMSACCGVYIDC